jgi:hypothetical protein
MSHTMNRFQRWVLLLVSYFLLWPTVVVLMDFRALADGGGWVFMTIMWATMAVALLPLLPFTIDTRVGRARRLRLIVPYACVFLGCFAVGLVLAPLPVSMADSRSTLRFCGDRAQGSLSPSRRYGVKQDWIKLVVCAVPGMAGR